MRYLIVDDDKSLKHAKIQKMGSLEPLKGGNQQNRDEIENYTSPGLNNDTPSQKEWIDCKPCFKIFLQDRTLLNCDESEWKGRW